MYWFWQHSHILSHQWRHWHWKLVVTCVYQWPRSEWGRWMRREALWRRAIATRKEGEQSVWLFAPCLASVHKSHHAEYIYPICVSSSKLRKQKKHNWLMSKIQTHRLWVIYLDTLQLLILHTLCVWILFATSSGLSSLARKHLHHLL